MGYVVWVCDVEVMWGLLSIDVGLWEYAYNYVFKGICIWIGGVRVGMSMWVRGRVVCVGWCNNKSSFENQC